MNSCLYWRRPEDLNKWKHYIWHLVKGIRLLDKVTTTVYRGIDRSNFTLELYKSGKRVVWNSITSCSQIESRAKSFFMKVDEFSFSHNSHITLHFLPTTTTTHFVVKQGSFKRSVFFHQGFRWPQTWKPLCISTGARSVVGTRIRICCHGFSVF